MYVRDSGMRSVISLLSILCVPLLAPAATYSYHMAGEDAGPWPGILSSVGWIPGAHAPSNLFIVRNGAAGGAAQWLDKISQGAVVVLEGDSEIAAALGIRPGK